MATDFTSNAATKSAIEAILKEKWVTEEIQRQYARDRVLLAILALCLRKYVDDIIITDELGGEQFRKPNDIAFRIMQNRWRLPFEQIVYVGDNVNKDFQAPRQLGMKFIYFKNPDGLYFYNGDDIFKTVQCISELEAAFE